MYIPVWLLFALIIWTWLGADLCRKEGYEAGLHKRTPDYRSCWGLASMVAGLFLVACAAILLVTPIAVTFVADIVDVAMGRIG